jgi:hypothetical protein
MAESEGFEPPEGYPSTVFKTAAFDHSASSPEFIVANTIPASGSVRLLAYYKHLPHGVIINLSKQPHLKANTQTPSY